MTSTATISGAELRQYVLASSTNNSQQRAQKVTSPISLFFGEISECVDNTPIFTLKNHDENQFRQHYKHCISPTIQKIENDRVNALIKLRKRCRIFILALLPLTIAFLGFKFLAPDFILYAVAGVFISVLSGILWLTHPARTYAVARKETLYTDVLKFFGADYSFTNYTTSIVETLKPSGIIPAYMSERTHNYTSGSHADVKLSIGHSELINHYPSGDDIVFSGSFILLTFPGAFCGNTVVKNDGNGSWLSQKFGPLEQVDLDKATPEPNWKIYSTNPSEAQSLLSASFMDRLSVLASLLGEGNLEFSFYENKLLLMLAATENKVTATSIFKPHPVTTEINDIIKKLEQILITIDQFNLEQKGAGILRQG